MALKRTKINYIVPFVLYPQILLAILMSLGIKVTLFEWTAHRLASSTKPTR